MAWSYVKTIFRFTIVYLLNIHNFMHIVVIPVLKGVYFILIYYTLYRNVYVKGIL